MSRRSLPLLAMAHEPSLRRTAATVHYRPLRAHSQRVRHLGLAMTEKLHNDPSIKASASAPAARWTDEDAARVVSTLMASQKKSTSKTKTKTKTKPPASASKAKKKPAAKKPTAKKTAAKAKAAPKKAAPKKAAAKKPAAKAAPKKAAPKKAAKAKPVKLLSGGNPQIAKGDGDGPVQAYIAAMPGWKSAVGRKLDALIVRTLPDVRKAVKWNSPFYGIEGNGWFMGLHVFTSYIKIAFLSGSSLTPPPPGTSKDKNTRYLDIHEDDKLDEKQLTKWLKQAADLPGWIP